MKIKIYSDGADFTSMLEMAKNPLVQGLTTNPSLMKKAGVADYRAFAKEVLTHIKSKPISFEVFADDLPTMRVQALEIASWGSNVYVKIPITNTEGISTCGLIKELTAKKIKLNVTALMTLRQVLDTCQSLHHGAPSIVSVFAGRIADTGRDPIPMMRAGLEICQSFGPQIELLWASSRELYNVVQADEIGCPIITVTKDIIQKIPMIGKDLDLLSLETVRTFKQDSDAAGFSF